MKKKTRKAEKRKRKTERTSKKKKKQRRECSQDKRQRKKKLQTKRGNVMTPNKKYSPKKIPKHKRSFRPEERARSLATGVAQSKQQQKREQEAISPLTKIGTDGVGKSIFTTFHPSTQASSSSAISFSPAAFALPQRVSSASAPVASFALVLVLAFHSPWTR